MLNTKVEEVIFKELSKPNTLDILGITNKKVYVFNFL